MIKKNIKKQCRIFFNKLNKIYYNEKKLFEKEIRLSFDSSKFKNKELFI